MLFLRESVQQTVEVAQHFDHRKAQEINILKMISRAFKVLTSYVPAFFYIFLDLSVCIIFLQPASVAVLLAFLFP